MTIRELSMRWIYLAVIVLFISAIVVFAFQNFSVVNVSFLGMRLQTRVAFLAVGIYLLGAVTGGGLFALLRRSFEGAKPRKGG
jgi:uncharacterized integral membrane protein